jgi:hypothetical protein
MAVSRHPSDRPSPPRKPPSDAGGQGKRESGQKGVPYGAENEYKHSEEHHPNADGYGHRMRHHHVGGGEHTSEFVGGEGFPKSDYPKAGDSDNE